MTMQDNRSSAEIERDVEQTRAGVADTLDQLRSRMTPGELADEVWDYARNGGGGEFVRNLGRGMRDNPIPVALVGVGLAWLMTGRGGKLPRLSRDQHPRRRDLYDYTGSTGGYSSVDDEADELHSAPFSSDYQSGGQSSDSLLGKAREAGHRAYDAVAGAGESVAEAASHVGDRASGLRHQASRRGRELGHRAYVASRDVRRTATDFANEQPLIVAAAGLAIGAALGAIMRTTDAEARLMGEASDRVKHQARELAEQGYEQAAAIAENTYEQVRDEAKAQGLTTEDAKDAVGGLGDRVKAVAERGKEALREEIGAAEKAAEKQVDENSPYAGA